MTDPARVAIVTGAARGIGAAVAHRLAQDGHRIAVLDLDAAACEPVAEAIVAAGGEAIALGADVGDEAAVQAAVGACAERLGPPTVLVNNAGITRDNLLFKMTTSDWDSAPGFIATDMLAATAARLGKPYDELLAEFAADIPVGRTGTVADIAAAVSFFVREEASFTTGQTLYVAGGPRC